jgi:dolichol kinase
MTSKIKVEVNRKLMHMFLGVVLVALLMWGIVGKWHLFVLLGVMIILFLFSKKYDIPGISWLMRNFEREDNLKKKPGKGFIFYIIGSLLVLIFFPLDIAMPAILVLAFADSISNLFGIRYGKIPHPYVSTKFVEGWVAGLVAGFIAALIFVPWYEALAASFFAMLVEGVEIKIGAEEVDDNLIIPLVAAIAIWSVRYFF